MPELARLPFSPDLQAQPEPGTAPEAFEELAETVERRLEAVDRLDLPGDPLDIRGLEAQQRVDRVRETFEDLGSGEPLYLVSDRDPTPVGEFLTDLVDADDDPTDALPEFAVERRGLEKWVLKAVCP